MSKNHPRNQQSQAQAQQDAATSAATLRAMIDFKPLCAPHGIGHIRLRTREGVWTGTGYGSVGLFVNADLDGVWLASDSPGARGLQVVLKNCDRYSRDEENLEHVRSEMREILQWGQGKKGQPTVKVHGQNYSPSLVLDAFNALGAPDTLIHTGYFTQCGRVGEAFNPIVWCMTGTVARHNWRMFVMPFAPECQAEGGAK